MENDTEQENLTEEEEILSSYYDTLNPRIQNILASDEITSVVNAIADEVGLTEVETEIFGNEIHLALLGFGNPINFAENLVNEGFPAEKAPRVAGTAQSKIFSQVKSEIEELYAEKSITPQETPEAPAPVVAKTTEPVVETRPLEPFIKTENATREPESVHTLDREALLRELESPEPFNVPFVPHKTAFEERVLGPDILPESVSMPLQETLSPEVSTPPNSHDLYREKPTL